MNNQRTFQHQRKISKMLIHSEAVNQLHPTFNFQSMHVFCTIQPVESVDSSSVEEQTETGTGQEVIDLMSTSIEVIDLVSIEGNSVEHANRVQQYRLFADDEDEQPSLFSDVNSLRNPSHEDRAVPIDTIYCIQKEQSTQSDSLSWFLQ
jgi:hypothetical protein